ncbi:sigma-54-dependent transcriptional regulator [Tahibacter amnicola]|uniref:Sigma-54 dependent transcriptional regulator n=1 Tax=Tahibacter amnicola TaxID=2976241 RepID=A0ABY6BIL1_9GAMM|nr:sigma-54 dependent transcriptional regulator [Tahibacter amnicola]UXI67692.1 sigma-54 dependent transcriptional regulator [Tahibacter amnicola]
MSKQTALVIDDERDIRELLTITLGRMNLDVDTVGSVGEAREMLAQRKYDLCFTDMRLPDGSGQEVIELIARQYPDTPVAMITAYGNVDAAVTALKAGAFDFVSKPVDLAMLRRLVQTALRLSEERRAGAVAVDGKLVGDSPAMQQVRATISKLARSQAPVYISGESGVGKELVARQIHEQGPRASGPFVPVNCGAIPSELMESEFFGHKKGSFTGAHADKDGLFQAAHGGTLFLDEVAELPLHMQVKLLRVIQEKSVRAIGGRTELAIDVRILSATHKNLAKLVEQGYFRQDLYYRINVIELRVPPLRERKEDVPKLVGRVLERLAADSGSAPARLKPEALKCLLEYDFPGNVRELENVLERAVALCEGNNVDVDDLGLSRPAPGEPMTQRADHGRETRSPDVPRTAEPVPAYAETAIPPPTPGIGMPADLAKAIADTERAAIMKALEATRWNRTAAAKQLGLTLRQLRYRLERLGIE